MGAQRSQGSILERLRYEIELCWEGDRDADVDGEFVDEGEELDVEDW